MAAATAAGAGAVTLDAATPSASWPVSEQALPVSFSSFVDIDSGEVDGPRDDEGPAVGRTQAWPAFEAFPSRKGRLDAIDPEDGDRERWLADTEDLAGRIADPQTLALLGLGLAVTALLAPGMAKARR